ncbi:MAG: DUF3658 domain-containing protein [Hyphomicrobium sp.]
MTTDPTPQPASTDPIADPRLDALILAAADSDWCKVTMLIARVTDAARAASIETTGQSIATRLYAMTADHRLEVQGNVRRWRAAQVRKPPAKK